MINKIGNFQHLIGEAGVAIDKQPMRLSNGVVWAHRTRWTFSIFVTPRASGLTQAQAITAVNNRVAAMQAAYKSGVDLRILAPDGSKTVHELIDKDTVGGVILTRPPSFPQFRGSEMVTIRTVQATFEAIVKVANPLDSYIWSHTESLRFAPSGWKRGIVETTNTAAVEQLLRVNQGYRATQAGTIAGIYDYPDQIPAAFWPAKLQDQYPLLIPLHPLEMHGSTPVGFPLQYEYTYVSSIPLPRSANPNIWLTDVS